MQTWERNPDIPEPQIESDGSDTSVTIIANDVFYLTFKFSSQAEAFAFIDQYANAYEVRGNPVSSPFSQEDEGTWEMYQDAKKRALEQIDGLRRGMGLDL